MVIPLSMAMIFGNEKENRACQIPRLTIEQLSAGKPPPTL